MDQSPPELSLVAVTEVVRGNGPRIVRDAEGAARQIIATTCDGIGVVRLGVVASDDQTPPERMRYRVNHAGGELPEGLALTGALSPVDGELVLLWPDGAHDRQEALDFQLQVAAIDLVGNESESQLLRVTNGGSQRLTAPGSTATSAHGCLGDDCPEVTTRGCSLTAAASANSHASTGGWPTLVLSLFALAGLRRGRRGGGCA